MICPYCGSSDIEYTGHMLGILSSLTYYCSCCRHWLDREDVKDADDREERE